MQQNGRKGLCAHSIYETKLIPWFGAFFFFIVRNFSRFAAIKLNSVDF